MKYVVGSTITQCTPDTAPDDGVIWVDNTGNAGVIWRERVCITGWDHDVWWSYVEPFLPLTVIYIPPTVAKNF